MSDFLRALSILGVMGSLVVLSPATSEAKKVTLSKAEVWPAHPFKNDTYLGHKTCGEPIKVSQWESAPITGAQVFVTAFSLCVKLTVQQECGCRTFETTYRKSKGQSKYGFHAVGASLEVPCPKPIAADMVAICKDRVTKEKCSKAPSVQLRSISRDVFPLTCPPELTPKKGMGIRPASPAQCEQCEPLKECYTEEKLAQWKSGCEATKADEEACKTAVVLKLDSHPFAFICAPGTDVRPNSNYTPALCSVCRPAIGTCQDPYQGRDPNYFLRQVCRK